MLSSAAASVSLLLAPLLPQLLLLSDAVPLASASGGATPVKVCNVLLPPFGAKGDNTTEDTAAVRAALAACSPGGLVLLPAGHVFLLRPIELPSNVELRVEGDIQGWTDIETWPNSTVRLCSVTAYEAKVPVYVPKKESLLWTVNSSGTTVSGGGTIRGGGERWWPLWKMGAANNYWHNCRPSIMEFGLGHGQPGQQGTNTDVTVTGVTLENSPFWTFVARGATNLLIDHVSITTPSCADGKNQGYAAAPNTDGFNIGGSSDITITNSYVRNRDDCVPLFPPLRNLTVRNITCECGNGLVPCTWPEESNPGMGGDISDVPTPGKV